MRRLPIVLVGDFTGAEFAPVADALSDTCDAQRASTIADALALLAAAGRSPVALVMAWPSPGVFTKNELSALRGAAPLARQFAVLGSWCEGPTRGGQIIPGLIRTAWRHWLPVWLDEFRAHNGASLPIWGLPDTAGDDDRVLARASRPWVARRGLTVIVGQHAQNAELLGQACRKRGYATVWLTQPGELARVGNPTVILWDGDARRTDELHALRRATQAPIVALVDFARVEDVRRACEAGAGAVLGRPLSWESLYWQIDQLTVAKSPTLAGPATPPLVRAG